MTTDSRIDKTIEIATRLASDLIGKWDNFPRAMDNERVYIATAAVDIAKAIIAEAEKGDEN